MPAARLHTHTQILTDSTVRSERSLSDVYAEHLPIIEAIAEGDARAARQRMSEHITTTGRLLLRQTLVHTAGFDALADAALLDARVEEIWDAHTGEF